MLYNTLVLPHLDYCCAVWMECGVTLCQQIERLQNYGMRIITSSPRLTHSADLRKELKWVTLEKRRQMLRLTTVHKCLHRKAPQYLCAKFVTNLSLGHRWTRGSNNLHLKRLATNFYRNSFEYRGAMDWNHLPNDIKAVGSESIFKNSCRSLFFTET